MTIYVYPNNKWNETLELVNNTSPYSLTGSVYIRDRLVIHVYMWRMLTDSSYPLFERETDYLITCT